MAGTTQCVSVATSLPVFPVHPWLLTWSVFLVFMITKMLVLLYYSRKVSLPDCPRLPFNIPNSKLAFSLSFLPMKSNDGAMREILNSTLIYLEMLIWQLYIWHQAYTTICYFFFSPFWSIAIGFGKRNYS